MDMEEDDSMEIDETMPAAPIIERRSDEFAITNISINEKIITVLESDKSLIESNSVKNLNTPAVVQPEEKKSNRKQDDVVVLVDDEDEPMKTTEGKVIIQKMHFSNTLFCRTS